MKNKDVLLDAIGDIDEKLIPDFTVKKKKLSILKRTALGGACAAAVIACMIILPKMNQNGSNTEPYVNKQPISDGGAKLEKEKIKSNIQFGDMGFESLMAYDISELDTPNPGKSVLTISSLPVYRNLAYNNLGIAVYLSEKQMKEIAKNTASTLDIDVNDTKVTYVKDFVQDGASDKLLNSVVSVDAECSNKTAITVYGDGQIKVSFKKQSVPSGYNFSYDNTSKEEAQKVLDYLSDKYADLLCYENAVCYSAADRTYSGDELRSYYIYNKSKNVVQDILNFNLSYSKFAPDDNGSLMCIWLNNPLCASKYAGDYPIITEQEATELLLSGNYYSTVPNDYIRNGSISKEDIAKTEIVYRNNREEYYQPYYKYYVELDPSVIDMADEAEGLKNYGIFYVPAIEHEYLADYTSTNNSPNRKNYN